MGPILADPDMRALFRNIMAETLAVGRAKGVALDPGYVEERMAFADKNMPPSMKASMANDLDRGNRLELDWLAGAVSRFGRDAACRRRSTTRSTPRSSATAWARKIRPAAAKTGAPDSRRQTAREHDEYRADACPIFLAKSSRISSMTAAARKNGRTFDGAA